MKEFFRMQVVSAAVLSAFCLSALTPAAAQTSEAEAVDAAIACRDITDDLERLACLDAAAETLSVTRIVREEAIAEQKRNERTFFGLGKRKNKESDDSLVTETPAEFGGEYLPENIKKRDEKRLKEITAKVAEFRVNQFGKVTVTLENGQVWRQLNSDNKRLIFSKKRKALHRQSEALDLRQLHDDREGAWPNHQSAPHRIVWPTHRNPPVFSAKSQLTLRQASKCARADIAAVTKHLWSAFPGSRATPPISRIWRQR